MICTNCGRKLKDSVSIERGLGLICWKKMHGVTRKEKGVLTGKISGHGRDSRLDEF